MGKDQFLLFSASFSSRLGAGLLGASARRRLRGTAVVPIDGVDFEPYLRVLLDVDPASRQRIAQRVAVVTDGDFYGLDGKQKVDRASNLRKLLADLGADESVAKVFANGTTLEPELLAVGQGNIALMREAWRNQRPRAWMDDWAQILEKDGIARAKHLADLLSRRGVRKGDFAQDLAALSADLGFPETLVAPAYFAEALRWITEESHRAH